jgi:hypothetical protein
MVLGIITCEILELEFAYILGRDPDLVRVTVLEDARSARLIRELESGGFLNVRCIPHLNNFVPEPSAQLEVLVRVLEVALHRRKEVLRKGLAGAVRQMSRYLDALLLGYGLCGNALENPEELFDVDVPLFLPMDGDHPVDDCVGMILGGRETYFAEQRRVPGTFFMTPGWTFHWKRMFGQDMGDVELKEIKRVFANYERALLVSTPVLSQEEMKRSGDEFSRFFGLCTQEREGTLDLLSQAWNRAKVFLRHQAGKPPVECERHSS